MSDVVLIRPRYNLASSLYNKPGRSGVKESYPPLGLYYLEAMLRQGGYAAEILDGLFLSRENISERVRVASPRAIGIYVVSSALPETLFLIKGLRLVSGAPIILGGPHITHCPESIRSFSADFGICGDGEESFLQLINFLIHGEGSIENIPGIILIRNNSCVVSKKADISELDALPFPNFSLASESPYFFPLSSDNMTTMISSRGCPFDCVYCGLPNKRCYKSRSVNNVLSEIKINIGKGYKYIDFKDDIFTYDMDRIENFCSGIIEEGIEFGWGCETRADFLSEGLIRLMKEAGCRNIKFGIESGVKRVQGAIGKIIPLDRVKVIFQLVRHYDMEVIAYFSLGHPGEKLSEMNKTIETVRELNPDYMDVTLCSPIPGSRLFDIAVEEGKISKDFWEKVDEIEIMPVYVPNDVKFEDIRKLQKYAYQRFYFNSSYLLCQLRKVKTLKELLDRSRIAFLLWKEACK